MQNPKCPCEIPPISAINYISCFIGVDKTNGRFGEVEIKKCISCHQFWLSYFVEYEAFLKSGRWFKGKIDYENIHTISPENAVDYLGGLSWFICGGSYFNSIGKISQGRINVDG